MRKIRFAVLSLFVIVAFSIQAQLLWQVSGPGVSKVSYLFGTHHLIEKDKINNFDQVLDKLKQVDVVIGEMEMSNLLGMQMKMMQGAIMKDNTLRDFLNEEDYMLVDNELKATIGAGLDKLGKMKPMMLSSMYTVMLYMQHHQLKKQPEAVDLIFQKAARKNKKEIIGLETVEQQIDLLFNSIPLERQAEMLVEGMKDKEKSLIELDQLNSAYVAGDLALIASYYLESSEMTAEENKILLDQRNNNWMIQLSGMLTDKSGFIAVGCMHLIGENGLINQLRKSGYVVEAVQF
jgi:hypothetical protein